MDKLAKVRAEVEKLNAQLLRGACSSQVAMETRCKEEAYNEVLAILDTMQKVPVSEEFEEALAREWQDYNDRGAATVDALEDNTQELAFAKGFYRGSKWQKNQGVTKEAIIGMATEEISINISQSTLDALDLCAGDKVII